MNGRISEVQTIQLLQLLAQQEALMRKADELTKQLEECHEENRRLREAHQQISVPVSNRFNILDLEGQEDTQVQEDVEMTSSHTAKKRRVAATKQVTVG